MVTQGTMTQAIEPQPEFRGILKRDVRFASGQDNSTSEAVNGWFDRLMLQSGIQTEPSVWLMLCLLTAVALGGLTFVAIEDFLLTAFATVFGMLAPILLAAVLRSRRQKQIMEQLPAMAEEMARAARSGRNVESSFMLVAADTPAPLGIELKLVARRTEMGIALGSAVQDLPERTGVAAVTMLTSAIGVHQETGGDLVQVLERLATAVRDRLHFFNRLRAATIASRLGAIMMLIIPPLVMGFFLFRNPLHLQELMASFWGRLSLWTGITLQVVGAFFVFRILRKSARF